MTPANALLQALSTADRILLTGPVAPDGDSIGACLALQRVLQARGLRADVAGAPSYRYDWLPGADRMVDDGDLEPGAYDAVVVVDGDRHRLTPPALRAFQGAAIRGIVDHHGSTRQDGYTHWWVEPTAASTCEMVFRALPGWGVALDRPLATQIYTGAIFDTGGFRYSNTTPETHRMAADLVAVGIEHAQICTRVLMERRISGLRLAGDVFTHATLHASGQIAIGRAPHALKARFDNVDGDMEGIVDALVHILGVEVAALLIERSPGDVKYSLRSRGLVDVSVVARELSPSGGGHPKAAGASIAGTLDEAEARVLAALIPRLERESA